MAQIGVMTSQVSTYLQIDQVAYIRYVQFWYASHTSINYLKVISLRMSLRNKINKQIKKDTNKNQTVKYREQTSDCQRGREGWVKDKGNEENTYQHLHCIINRTVESLHCTSETNIKLQANYTSIFKEIQTSCCQIKKKDKKRMSLRYKIIISKAFDRNFHIAF